MLVLIEVYQHSREQESLVFRMNPRACESGLVEGGSSPVERLGEPWADDRMPQVDQ